jgi:hypothetical protein
MPIVKPDYDLPEEYRQLALELDAAGEAGISPDEARVRSEAAMRAFMRLKGTKEQPGWFEEFRNLWDGGWPWRQAVYIAWASTPRVGRQPNSQDELAKTLLGLTTDRAISTWRKRNPAIDEMIAVLQSAPLLKHRADYFQALDVGARQAGSDYKFFNHLKLTLEILGIYVPISELRALIRKKVGSDREDMDEMELDTLLKDIHQAERKGKLEDESPAQEGKE